MARRIVPSACGSDFNNWFGYTLCISEGGDVHSFGKHPKGGHGHSDDAVYQPSRIPSLKNIISICCGNEHTVCLDENGDVFTLGSNIFGQLGIRKEVELVRFTNEPQKVSLPKIKQISCGFDFTICLSEDGGLYSFGNNELGQLGIGKSTHNYTYPQRIKSLKNIDFVECGYDYTICKSFQNKIYAWGRNKYGKFGIGNTDNHKKPYKCKNWINEEIIDIKCGYYHTLVLTSTKKVYFCGHNPSEYDNSGDYLTLQKLHHPEEVIRIECGTNAIIFDTDNTLYVIGIGQLCNIKDALKLPNIIDISIGGNHFLAKNLSNEIFAYGYNKYSQLGIETKEQEYVYDPIQVFQDNEDIWHSNIKPYAKSAKK